MRPRTPTSNAEPLILVLNPGGGSTKVAICRGNRPVFRAVVRHAPSARSCTSGLLSQLPERRAAVEAALRDSRIPFGALDAISCIGGPLRPLSGGVYRVTKKVVRDIANGRVQTQHVSLLGPLLANELGDAYGIPAFFVDPVSVDEFWPVSRLTGLPDIRRKALSHALSIKAACRWAASLLGKSLNRTRFVVVHLGTGISVAACAGGRLVDTTNANEEGPFSTQRAGTLPTISLLRLEEHERREGRALADRINCRGGLVAHLGTDDLGEVETRVKKGDRLAREVYDAMVYNIAKSVGAYAAALRFRVDAVIMTGGMAQSSRLMRRIRLWVRDCAEHFIVLPGDRETEALADGARRVLCGETRPKPY